MNIKRIREYKNYLEEFIVFAEKMNHNEEFDYQIQKIDEQLLRGTDLQKKILEQLNRNNSESEKAKNLMDSLNNGSFEDYLAGNL